MGAFLDRLSQSLTSKILSVIIGAIIGYYSGIFGLKGEIYALREENLKIQDSWRNEIKDVKEIIMDLKILIIKNEQYINGIADPSIKKLDEFEKKLYELEKNVEINNIKNRSSSKKK